MTSYHPVEWTPERIERFWNFYSANAAARGSYFSSRFGGAIVRLVRRQVELAGTLVDLGCGRGDLIGELLRQGFACQAIDSSVQAVDRVRERFAAHPGFRGACEGRLDRIPLQDGEAGAVFLIEVLEHLTPEDAAKALAEIRRVIRPGGHLIATVPNQEDLEAQAVACPECGCVFHRMQHVRSFDDQSLARLITGVGFEAAFVGSVNLKDYAGNRLMGAIGAARRAARAFRRRRNPHLIAVGRRLPS